jgi:alpha-mannosidase
MKLRRASLVMPCSRLEDLPRYLRGAEAAELLAAWTSLWHPALVAATESLPGCHTADSLPEPDALEAELVVVPGVSLERMPGDWIDRLHATSPRNPSPVAARAARAETVAAALDSAGIAAGVVDKEVAADFLALGYAHLQVELLTRAMRYTTLLDAERFREAVIGAAGAAVRGDAEKARDGLAQAFDLLADARNHFYAVDFYLVDVTLLVETMLGEPLRTKLHSGLATNLLTTGELLQRLESNHPETLVSLRKVVDGGRACVLSGPLSGNSLHRLTAEGILAELLASNAIYRRVLAREPEIYGQFGASFSPLLPEILKGGFFDAALYTNFDGGRIERPPQPKVRWGKADGPSIQILSAVPRDIAEPATWLLMGEHIGDTLVRDHVATILLAGWPGQASEYYDDLRRIAEYGPVLGRFITLDEYFRSTSDADDWAVFKPREHASPVTCDEQPITRLVETFRREVRESFGRLQAEFASFIETATLTSGADQRKSAVVLNPWNFPCPRYVDFDPVAFDRTRGASGEYYPTPGWGYAIRPADRDMRAPLAEGRVLRNEFLEVVISEASGGIQSMRTHRDRATRVSQRLVAHDRRLPRKAPGEREKARHPALNTQMVADELCVERSDGLVGEIAARGRLLDVDGKPLARFVQTTRVVRGLPVVIVDVRLELEWQPAGNPWSSYYASRMTWREDALVVRRGVNWQARETSKRQIESPEWVEISDGERSCTCFGLGLPYHTLGDPTWLDTILAVQGDTGEHRQFAIGLDCANPTATSLAALTAGFAQPLELPSAVPSPQGWLFHLGAKNVVVTHFELLDGGASRGLRVRLLESAGVAVRTRLTAFRPMREARRTDLCGRDSEALPVVDGRVTLEFGPHRWLQVEAEW